MNAISKAIISIVVCKAVIEPLIKAWELDRHAKNITSAVIKFVTTRIKITQYAFFVLYHLFTLVLSTSMLVLFWISNMSTAHFRDLFLAVFMLKIAADSWADLSMAVAKYIYSQRKPLPADKPVYP